MNNCKYPFVAAAVIGFGMVHPSFALYSIDPFGFNVFDDLFAELREASKFATTEKVESPHITVTQEDKEIVITLEARNIDGDKIEIQVDNNCMTVKVPDTKSSMTLTFNNDERIKKGVMHVTAYVKTIEEKKDDKGNLISSSSGAAHMKQTKLLPVLLGDMNAVKAEYKDDMLTLRIPIYEPKKIDVKVCTSPGLK